MKILVIFSLLFALCSITAFATDRYPFKTPKQQQQFQRVTSDLRCMVCQNESLAASNSKFANDMRLEIYHMVQQGKTNKEIVNRMESRYGYFVSFKPPFDWETLLLWLGPVLLFILAIFIGRSVHRKYKR